MGIQKKTTSKKIPLRISTNALRHLDEIMGYIAFIRQQPLTAIKIGDAFFEAFNNIAGNPFAFRECEELSTKTKMYRRAACHSWSIVFKIMPAEIIILGIIHHSRKPGAYRTLGKIK